MTITAYCPQCRTAEPHRVASEEMGHVLWCQRCQYVHLPARPEDECGDCHYWCFGQCLCVDAMALKAPAEQCLHKRPRKQLPEPSDF